MKELRKVLQSHRTYSMGPVERGLVLSLITVLLVLGVSLVVLGQQRAQAAHLSVVFSTAAHGHIAPSVERFMAEHPNVKVDVLGFDDDREAFILTRQIAGMPLDIMEASTTIAPMLIAANVGMDLSVLLDKDGNLHRRDFINYALRPFLRGERLYALPIELRMYVPAINLDDFDNAGLINPNDLARADWDWGRMEAKAKKLTLVGADGAVVRHGVGFRWDTPLSMIYQAGGRLFDDPSQPTRSSFLSPGALAAFDFLSGLFVPNQYGRVDGSLGKKQSAMFMGQTTRSSVDLLATDVRHDIVRYPRGPVDDTMLVGVTGVMMNSQSAYPAEAWSLLKHLIMDPKLAQENIQTTMRPSAYLPHVPLYSKRNFTPELPPGVALFQEFLISPTTDTAPAFAGWDDIVLAYREAVRKDLQLGTKPPRQILEELDNVSRTYLERLNAKQVSLQ